MPKTNTALREKAKRDCFRFSAGISYFSIIHSGKWKKRFACGCLRAFGEHVDRAAAVLPTLSYVASKTL